MTGTIYPAQIDGNSQLPLIVDLTSPMQAANVNNVRNAVIAVETELGVNPSATYGTVKDRIDALENLVALLAGDGYGSLSLAIDYISGLIEIPSDKAYTLTLAIPFAGYIDTTSTRAGSGTATAVFGIQGTPLGGGSHAVSTSEVTNFHVANNVFVPGDDITITFSSVSLAEDVSFTAVFVRT